jgi:membrane-associated protein
VMVAPFLPVLNALLPLAAGGLRMSYRRFVACATVGSVLWAGLYVLLAVAARSLGGLLPGETFAMVGTVAIGLVFGWLVLLSIRRRLGIAAMEDA